MAVGKKSSAVTVLLAVVAGRYDPRGPGAVRAHHLPPSPGSPSSRWRSG